MLSIDAVADYFIAEAAKREFSFTNLTLQRLAYYAQGWHLALRDEPIFEEDFEAWVHGPAIPALYQRFASFSAFPIPPSAGNKVRKMKPAVHNQLFSALKEYGMAGPSTLEFMVRSEPPWRQARGNTAPMAACSTIITKDRMKARFKALATERNYERLINYGRT